MDMRFRPPKKSDDRQWAKVRFLVEHGFFFQRVYLKDGAIWYREAYPKNMNEAKEFVVRFKDQALSHSA